MSSGVPCHDRTAHRPSWRVMVRKANYSAFNGYHRTASDYSRVSCMACPSGWRTKAAYVDTLPDWDGVEQQQQRPAE